MALGYEFYVEKILSGDKAFLAKAITLVESLSQDHRNKGKKIIKRLLSERSKSIRIGISGIPGVGKSSFIESFGIMLLKKGYKVAVLAIDPSSKVSGGSIMADKTRMKELSSHSNAFVRPSPSGGSLGGVARMTREIIVICEAAGFDVIIVETVGVGQSEIAVSSMVDFFLVLMLYDAGDELQGIKKGLVEMADGIVINKADGENISRAERARNMYQSSMRLITPLANNAWIPPVMMCSSISSLGLREIWKNILFHRKKKYQSGSFFKDRSDQLVDWMWMCVKNDIEEYLLSKGRENKEIREILDNVRYGKFSSILGSEIVLSLLKK